MSSAAHSDAVCTLAFHYVHATLCRYNELQAIVSESGGPYMPGVDGGAVRGGDGGERARKKAEEHAAAEAAKWGR